MKLAAAPGIELDRATVTTAENGARTIRVELVGYLTPSLNRAQRQHFHARGAKKTNVAGRIALQLVGKRPPAPFARARVTIERHAAGTQLDTDNLWGGTKDLIDCLLDPGPPVVRKGKTTFRHPSGLGIVADDAPAVLERRVVPVRVQKRRDQKTVVTIEELV